MTTLALFGTCFFLWLALFFFAMSFVSNFKLMMINGAILSFSGALLIIGYLLNH